jgi:hypothetical protein
MKAWFKLNPWEDRRDIVMAVQESRGDGATKWIRWIARGLGSLVAGLWLLTGILHAFVEPEPWTLESSILAVLIIASAVGVLIAWWREGIGGTIVVVVGIAYSAFAWVAAGHNKGFAMLISGGPFLVVGTLFLVSWWSSDKQRPAGMDQHGGENGQFP